MDTGFTSRSFEPSARVAGRKPRWYLRSADEASARSRSRPSEAPELHQTGSGFTLTLSAAVAKGIEEQVLAAIWEFDSREIETGGYLYGHDPPDEDGIWVCFASGPGHNGKHASGQVQLSDPSEIESAFHASLVRQDLIRLGDWHSHPAPDPLPSDADLWAWARHSDAAGVLPYAGLIVTPGEIGWMTPEFHGWVTREDDHGVLVCEPAPIEESW